MPSLVNEWFYLSSARFLLVKTVQYSSQRRGTPNLHLLSHPLTLRRCNLSNESNCIVCHDAPLEFLNLPWCPSPVTGIAVVPSLTQTFPRQELQCPMTNEIRPLPWECVTGAPQEPKPVMLQLNNPPTLMTVVCTRIYFYLLGAFLKS